jgi:predicted DNA-binding transcriptional regulator AlpA
MNNQKVRLKDQKGITGVSNSTFLRWVDSGLMPPGQKIGGCRIWDCKEILERLNNADQA